MSTSWHVGYTRGPQDHRTDGGRVTGERRRTGEVGAPIDPPFLYPAYGSTVLRAPARPPGLLLFGPSELTGPTGAALLEGRGPSEVAADLTRQHAGVPLGERI